MDIIPIKAVPNQSFLITLDGHFYSITLQAGPGIMAASITRDSAIIINGMRCVAGKSIIPYRYLEGGAGNFIFITDAQQLPDWTKFNTTQHFAYYTADELAFFRQPPPAQITADFFNPLGALPLRFKPAGYS